MSRRQWVAAGAAVAGAASLCAILAILLQPATFRGADLEGIGTTAFTPMAPARATSSPTAANTRLVAPSSTPAATATSTQTPTGTARSTVTLTHTPRWTETATEEPSSTPLPPTTTLPPPEPTVTHSPTPIPRAVSEGTEMILVDHSSTDIAAIPQAWIEQAKSELHIAYGHTSHGGQVTHGMAALVDFANNGGLGLELSHDILAYNSGGKDGALDLRQPFDGDAGYYPQWVNETTTYLGPPDPVTGRGTARPEVNVVMWAWCGQVSDSTEQQMLDEYLLPMSQLEADYSGVTFVYMTGHADGTGKDGNLHLRNQQIRDYCLANGKVLYDFYDIELYDPDGSYYGDKSVQDNCDYDSDGNGTRDRNWAIDWQNAHIEDSDWYVCTCTHSQPLNCNRKAYAAWSLWARLAGWDGR